MKNANNSKITCTCTQFLYGAKDLELSGRKCWIGADSMVSKFGTPKTAPPGPALPSS